MIQRALTLLGASLMLTAVGAGQQTMQMKKSLESDVEFKATNFGVFGLDVMANSSGFIVPRGSGKAYMFGSGLWFAAQKESGGRMNKLCFVTYNPNSGASWATPGEGYMASIPESGAPARPDLYHSVEYDRQTGVHKDPAVPPATAPNWPLWLVGGERPTPFYSGTFVPFNKDRMPGTSCNFVAPAFMPGVDEQLVSRFHDGDLSRYEQIDQVSARMQGYPVGLQIQQNIYAWRNGLLKDVVVLEYTIINPTNQTLHDCVVGQVSDPDLGSPANDRGDFYDSRPELRTAFNWTDSESSGEYGALATTLLEAPMVDADGFVDNSRRSEFRRDGRVGTYRNWTIEMDPITGAERYDFIGAGTVDGDYGPGDKRTIVASRKFSMRPGDTAHFAIAYSVIPVAPEAAKKGETAIAGGRTSIQLERVIDGLGEAYYNREEFKALAVPGQGARVASGLSLLPNPSRDRASIAFTLPSRGAAAINVVDGLGNTVLELALDGLDAGEHSRELDLRGVRPGAYIVAVRTSEGVATTKLTVVR